MKPAQQKPADELRMKSSEFDKIMRRVLRVHPEPAPKAKPAKPKAALKKCRVAK